MSEISACPGPAAPLRGGSRRAAAAPALVLAALLALPAAPCHAGARVRGLCWEAGEQVAQQDFEPVRALGAGWIAQTPFGWQRSAQAPEFRMATGSVLGFGPFWGETDAGLAETARLARANNIKVMLKPHLWLRGGRWIGEIRMKNERDWHEWFRRYTEFVVHYAALAEREKMEMLCVGVELKGTATREKDWRAVIAAVRKVYHGKLTYAANWDGEVDSVAFWDALDAIGVQAYYPLAEGPSPGGEELRKGWEPWRARLAGAASRWNRPVIFTEVGYKSCASAAGRPWEWDPDGPVDLELQARCYEALFQSLWSQPWFGGVFLWKWHPQYDRAGGPEDRNFTPQRKPAERVIRAWFEAPG